MSESPQTSNDGPDADHLAREGARMFALAALGQDVVHNAVLGLSCVLRLSDHEDVTKISEASVRTMADAIRALTPVLAGVVDYSFSAERVYLAMGAAAGLVDLFGKNPEQVSKSSTLEIVLDQVDHSAWLAADLCALVRRQSIEARGNPLLRAIETRRFVNLQRTDDSILN